MKLELTHQEANAMIQLIDMAVKSGGLQVARAATILTEKIQMAAKEKNQSPELVKSEQTESVAVSA